MHKCAFLFLCLVARCSLVHCTQHTAQIFQCVCVCVCAWIWLISIVTHRRAYSIAMAWKKNNILYLYKYKNVHLNFISKAQVSRARVHGHLYHFDLCVCAFVCTSILFVAAHAYFFSFLIFKSDAKTMQNDFRRGNSLNSFCDYYKKIKMYIAVFVFIVWVKLAHTLRYM